MQQQPHSAFSPPFCSDELSPDSSVGQEGKGGEGEPQGEDHSQSEPEPPQQQPQQLEQKPEPQTLPSQPQPEPEPQTEPQLLPEVEPQSEPEPEASPEPDPQPQVESLSDAVPHEAPSCSTDEEEKINVEAENHKSEEVAEAMTRHERDEVQDESCESKATQEEEDEEDGGAKGGGAGRRASLHHTASPLRVQRNGAGSHSASSDYELSLDLKNKQVWLSRGRGLCWCVFGALGGGG